jgi:UDP-glucuronate 4-epimerase
MKILVTGSSGFIGYHSAKAFCENGYSVLGIDNHNNYYDASLKRQRLALLSKNKKFRFKRCDIRDQQALEKIFQNYRPEIVLHLAAQAGVRYSLENPQEYIENNLNGFFNVIEASRKAGVHAFYYASSSSVYGDGVIAACAEQACADHPASLYAATKRSNELIAYSYSKLHGLKTTGLRFFSVYGPWGRPDMAYFLFTEAIYNGKKLKLYGGGKLRRAFTYIDDVVKTLTKLVKVDLAKKSRQQKNYVPAETYNIGGGRPVSIVNFLRLLERQIGISAKVEVRSVVKGDVASTWADAQKIEKITGRVASTKLSTGLGKFIDWYARWKRLEVRPKSNILKVR